MSNTDTLTEATRDAAASVAGKISDLQQKGQDAAERAKDVGTSLKDALDESIRTRPYTTLLAAAALGFLYAVARRG